MTLAEILRKKADGLQPKIDHCFAQRLTNTRKRAEEDAHQRREGNTLKTIQAVMRRMADLHEAGTCPDALKPWKDITVIGTAVRVVRSAQRQKEEFGDREGTCLARLTDEQRIIQGLMQPVDPRAERLHALVRDSVRWNISGFFPTPRKTVEQMLELAAFPEVTASPYYLRVLEPSAGRGDILDVIRERYPEASLTAVEPAPSLREILSLKGYDVQTEGDFMQWAPCEGVLFDRILMNPPFEKFQDIEHVRRAYTFLKPSGRLVAIMGNGAFFRQEKKAEQFQEDYADCHTIPLESGTFETTGVASRIIVIDKPAAPSCDYCDAIFAMTGNRQCPIHGGPLPPSFDAYGRERRVLTAPESRRLSDLTGKRASFGLTPQETSERNRLLTIFHIQMKDVPATAPPIAGQADTEYQTRIDAERVTAEFATHSARRLDGGRRPIAEAPLFGGEAQLSLF